MFTSEILTLQPVAGMSNDRLRSQFASKWKHRARDHDLTAFLWHVLWPSSRSSSTEASTFLAYIKIVLGLMRFSRVVFF